MGRDEVLFLEGSPYFHCVFGFVVEFWDCVALIKKSLKESFVEVDVVADEWGFVEGVLGEEFVDLVASF